MACLLLFEGFEELRAVPGPEPLVFWGGPYGPPWPCCCQLIFSLVPRGPGASEEVVGGWFVVEETVSETREEEERWTTCEMGTER